MVLNKGSLPASARAHRVMCAPLPPRDESIGGIIIPSVAQARPSAGTIIGAGLNALDAMYDHGDQVGDEVWWGKFAGVLEEWDRIVDEGKGWATCNHRWDRARSPGPEHHAFVCGHCKSYRMVSPLAVLNHDDILCNVDLQKRIESGVVAQKRGKTSDGRTQHFMDRKEDGSLKDRMAALPRPSAKVARRARRTPAVIAITSTGRNG